MSIEQLFWRGGRLCQPSLSGIIGRLGRLWCEHNRVFAVMESIHYLLIQSKIRTTQCQPGQTACRTLYQCVPIVIAVVQSSGGGGGSLISWRWHGRNRHIVHTSNTWDSIRLQQGDRNRGPEHRPTDQQIRNQSAAVSVAVMEEMFTWFGALVRRRKENWTREVGHSEGQSWHEANSKVCSVFI